MNEPWAWALSVRRLFASCAVAVCVLNLCIGFASAQNRGSASRSGSDPLDEFIETARAAIASPGGGVVVAVVMANMDSTFGSVEVTLSVDVVIKVPRSDEGVYFVPTTVRTSRPGLEKGSRYAIALTSVTVVKGAIKLESPSAAEAMIASLRRTAAESAVFGTTEALVRILRRKWDDSGVRTLRSDGAVEPGAFGLSQNDVVEFVKKRAGIYVVWYQARQFGDRGRSWEVSIVETLHGARLDLDGRIVVGVRGESDDMSAGFKVRSPYVRVAITALCPCIIVTAPGGGGIDVVRRVPLIGTNDGCVRMVRQWIEEARAAESRPDSRPSPK